MEQEYVKRHGKLPDYHYTELWNRYGGAMANKIVQDNIDSIWAEMKDRVSPTFHTANDSPFQPSDNRTNGKEGVTV